MTKPVTSNERKGALRELFDRQCRPHADAQQASEAREPLTGLRILFAEDNPVIEKLVLELLESRGHIARSVSDGRQAVAGVTCERFDAVLMDIQMPELDGIEATRCIRELEKYGGGHIPIIALTAHAMKADQERCFAAGMDAYIAKLITVDRLFRIIDEQVRSHRSVPETDSAPLNLP
ncbi:MAG: response regulator [Acidobacteriota bacterium]|nr:MAG: response regulator [Acidobacteriota bacterium]